jgi:hypothetical protein
MQAAAEGAKPKMEADLVRWTHGLLLRLASCLFFALLLLLLLL